jgi:Fur family iron response transcriptional regulator
MDQQVISELLQKHEIYPTPQRVDIAMVMLDEFQHLSADQVLAKVNGNGSLVSKATVYNTLGLFAERGLIREVIVDPTRVFYDSNTSPHYHFYNVDEGTLMDFDAVGMSLSTIPEIPEGMIAEGVDVIVRVRNKSYGSRINLSL